MSLRFRIATMFAAIAIAASIMTMALVLVMVRVSLGDDIDADVLRRVMASAKVAVVVVVGAIAVVTAGATAYLTSWIGSRLRRMHEATVEIAQGQFEHRIADTHNDDLGKIAASIDDMASQLQQLDAQRQQILASVSHELRTPLTVIRSAAFTLGRHEVDDVRRDRFELIDDESQRLASMIDDLLTAATLRSRRLRLQLKQEALNVFADRAQARFANAARRKGVAIDVHTCVDEPCVMVDSLRLDQVLGNLMANAVAHAPANTSVSLVTETFGDSSQIIVTNSGLPIPASDIERMFVPFEQGANATGTVGLGLAIASQLVELHGGSLSAHSSTSATSFVVQLPSSFAVDVSRNLAS